MKHRSFPILMLELLQNAIKVYGALPEEDDDQTLITAAAINNHKTTRYAICLCRQESASGGFHALRLLFELFKVVFGSGYSSFMPMANIYLFEVGVTRHR